MEAPLIEDNFLQCTNCKIYYNAGQWKKALGYVQKGRQQLSSRRGIGADWSASVYTASNGTIIWMSTIKMHATANKKQTNRRAHQAALLRLQEGQRTLDRESHPTRPTT